MIVLHTLSWLAFLAIIPVTAAILFIKNRSAVSPWIRIIRQPNRWLLSTILPKDSTPEQITSQIKNVVSQARNSEWDAACTYKRRNHQTGEWIIGLISNTEPLDTEVAEPFSFSNLPSSRVIRVSGEPQDEGATIKGSLAEWAGKKNITHSPIACSISAQSFQC